MVDAKLYRFSYLGNNELNKKRLDQGGLWNSTLRATAWLWPTFQTTFQLYTRSVTDLARFEFYKNLIIKLLYKLTSTLRKPFLLSRNTQSHSNLRFRWCLVDEVINSTFSTIIGQLAMFVWQWLVTWWTEWLRRLANQSAIACIAKTVAPAWSIGT